MISVRSSGESGLQFARQGYPGATDGRLSIRCDPAGRVQEARSGAETVLAYWTGQTWRFFQMPVTCDKVFELRFSREVFPVGLRSTGKENIELSTRLFSPIYSEVF